MAVGGDGSVNEVATGLLGSSCLLGIIPTGSGNGLARTLNIPLQPKKAVELLNRANVKAIDVLQVGQRISLCAAGFGFDAAISKSFSTLKTRGFWSYVRLGLSSYFGYKPTVFKVEIDGELHEFSNNLILSIANSNQYGNDIFISPSASLFDGFLRLIALEKAAWYRIPYLFYCLRTNQLNKFRGFNEIKATELTIFNPKHLAHVDGEPISTSDKVKVKVLPNALNVFVP